MKRVIRYQPTGRAEALIDHLLASGLYGTTREEVVDRLVCRELERMVVDEMFRKLRDPWSRS